MFMQLNRYVAKHKNLIFWGLLIAIAIPFILVFGNTGDALRSGRLFSSDSYGTMFGREVEYDDVRLQIFGIYVNATRTGQPYSFAGGQFRQNPLYIYDVASFKLLANRLSGQERHKYTQMFGNQTLQRMRILHEAKVQGFADVSDDEVRKAIQKFPPFQDEGKFSRLKYDEFRLDVVESTFLTMVAFEQCIRDSIVIARFESRFRLGTTNNVVGRSNFVQSFTEVDGRIRMFNPSYSPDEKVKVTEAEIKTAYDSQKNKGGRYYVPPKKSLYLVSFKAEADEPEVSVSDKEIEERYKKDLKSRYTAEEAKVRHILIEVTPGAKQEKWDAALKKIKGILKEARGGKDFAELAKTHSDDPGSKDKGGLYDFYPRGRMVKPFDDAAFSLKKGKISEPVKTMYGYHIIKKLDGRTTVTPLDKAKDSIKRVIEREKIKVIWSGLAKAEYDKELAEDKTRKLEDKKYTKKQHQLLHLLIRNKAGASEDDKKLNLDKAKKILSEAKKAKDFKALAKKHSDGPAKDKGGDLGFVTEADLTGDLTPLAPALKLKAGEITKEVITSSVGYHIVKKVAEKIAPVPFEKVKEDIIQRAKDGADEEAATAAEKAAKDLSSACFNEIREMKKFEDIQDVFKQHAAKRKLTVVKTGYFGDDAYTIARVPGSARPVIDAAKMLTENQPLSGVIKNMSYRFVVCLADRKEGYVPELKDVRRRVEMDLEQTKRIEAARKNAEIEKKRIKDELAKGVPFSTIKDAHRFIPIPPRSRSRRPNPDFEQARSLARNLKAGDLTVMNTAYGAYLIYAAEQTLPPADIYTYFSEPQSRQIPQQMGYEMLSGALQELETKHKFIPSERWAALFAPEEPVR